MHGQLGAPALALRCPANHLRPSASRHEPIHNLLRTCPHARHTPSRSEGRTARWWRAAQLGFLAPSVASRQAWSCANAETHSSPFAVLDANHVERLRSPALMFCWPNGRHSLWHLFEQLRRPEHSSTQSDPVHHAHALPQTGTHVEPEGEQARGVAGKIRAAEPRHELARFRVAAFRARPSVPSTLHRCEGAQRQKCCHG